MPGVLIYLNFFTVNGYEYGSQVGYGYGYEYKYLGTDLGTNFGDGYGYVRVPTSGTKWVQVRVLELVPGYGYGY